jgi:hypothetical protein
MSVAGALESAKQDARRLSERESLARAMSWHRVWPVKEVRGDLFDLGRASLAIPGFGAFGARVSALAAGACTLGAALEARVGALWQAPNRLLALELDALGTELLFALAARAVAGIRREARRQGLEASAELNPGDPGLGLEAQPLVLALAGAERGGVRALERGMLNPVKSLSFVVALGRNLPGRAMQRCARCPARRRCRVRPS